jgi:DDE_Tnp_1-associated
MISHPRPLIEVFAEMPDFRSARGKRHPLAVLLALTCSAMLCGARSYTAIAEWGRNYGARLMQALGFTPPAAVCRDAPHRFAAGGSGGGGSQAGGMG